MALRGQFRLLVGSLRLGDHLRGLAALKPRIWDCPGSIRELDVQLHCRSDHAGYAGVFEVWDIYFLRADDIRGRDLHLVLCTRDEAIDLRGDGYALWECGCG